MIQGIQGDETGQEVMSDFKRDKKDLELPTYHKNRLTRSWMGQSSEFTEQATFKSLS